MDTEQIIQVINATAGATSGLLSQVAWFLAIEQAAHWLSLSFPALVLFGVIMRVKKNTKDPKEEDKGPLGILVLAGWLLFAFTVYTSVKGLAHIAQAGFAPTMYVADQIGGIDSLKDVIKTK